MQYRSISFFLCMLGLMTACVQVDKPELQASLTLDSSEMNFRAEFTDMKNDSTVVLVVTANRSWFAVLNDLDNPIDPSDESQSVSWGSINVNGHTNLTSQTDTVHLQVTLNRNKSQVPVNGTLDFYACGGMIARVKLNQAGAVYHLDAIPEKFEAECREGKVRINVDCNTFWNAEIVESTAEVELVGASSYDPGFVELNFAENTDVTSTRYAKVKFSAESCQDKVITITQKQAEPYAEWSGLMSTKLHSWEQTGKLVFRTNCAWTLEHTGGTLENVAISQASGEAGVIGEQEVSFTFANSGKDPMEISTAEFVLKTEYTEPISIVLTHRPQLVVNLTSSAIYTPTLPTSSKAVETTHYFDYEGNTYSVSMMLTAFDKNKLRFLGSDGTVNGFIKFPAIEDATLAAVEITIKSNTTYYKTKSAIYTADGTTQVSDIFSYSSTAGATHLFILGENGNVPVMGKTYMLQGLEKITCCINKIVLYYE